MSFAQPAARVELTLAVIDKRLELNQQAHSEAIFRGDTGAARALKSCVDDLLDQRLAITDVRGH